VADRSPLLPEKIVGERLVLRRWLVSDAQELSRAVERNIEHLRPWMPWVADEPLPVDRRVALIEEWERALLDGGDAVYGVFLENAPIGGCGLHRRRGPHGLEIGYWIDRDHINRGIGTEVARLLTSAALAVPGVTFVEIHHDKANTAFGRIPERLGYSPLREERDRIEAPGEMGVDCGWRMTAADWSSPSAR